MTKRQEIEILEKAIAKLGPDSYLGPWLTQVKDEVESIIRSDFFPDITLNAAVDNGNNLIARARAEATDIVAAAKLKAAQIENDADKHKRAAADAVRAAIYALERW